MYNILKTQAPAKSRSFLLLYASGKNDMLQFLG
jgi:hypothetical protein